jgi:ligand-binding sensor domain-containing protein/two-component sensor histidine kinase
VRKVAFFVLCLLLSALTPAFCRDDERHFEHLSIAQGLSSNDVTTVLQDHLGFLWIGTSNGLNRYDGQDIVRFFHSYHDSNSIAGDDIIRLAEINRKYIFIATTRGLSIYNLQTNTFQNSLIQLSPNASTSRHYISTIFQDHLRQIYISFDNQFKVFDSSFHFLYALTDLPNSTQLRSVMLKSIQEDRQGRLWILTYSGLVAFDPETKELFNQNYNPNHWKIFNFDCAFYGFTLDQKNEILYFSCWNRPLFTFNAATNNIVERKIEDQSSTKINYQSLTNFLIDETHILWVGSEEGLCKVELADSSVKGFIHDDSNPFSLSSNHISSLLIDRDQNLWIGTDNGLNRLSLKNSPFQIYSFRKVLPAKGELSGIVKINQSLLVSTWNNGLWKRSDDGSWSKITIDATHRNSVVIWDLYKSDAGKLWLATEGGLYVSDIKNQLSFHHPENYPDSLKHEKTIAVFEDSHHDVWASMHGAVGLLHYESSSGVWKLYRNSFPPPNNLPARQFASITEGSAGQMWFGNHFYDDAGVVSWNRNTEIFQKYGMKNDIPDNVLGENMNDLYIDRNNLLWIGSGDYGLIRMNTVTGQYKIYTRDDGLPDNQVDAIADDRNGFLWLATSNGIARFDPRSEKCTDFGFSYGLPIEKFNSQCFYDSIENEIYFTTASDIICFNPDEVSDDRSSSPPIITGVKSGGENISSFSSKEPEIDYSRNALNFTFTAINFREGRSTQYAYRLDGYDKDWNYCGNIRAASYDNLSPGNYTFRVKAANGAGLWNETAALFPFIISPPFYDRWWFIASCTLAVLIILYAIYRVRVSRLLAVEKLRSRISRDLHDEVGSTLSSITMLSRLARSKVNGEKNPLDSLIMRIEEGSQRMTQNMQDIVWAVNPGNDSMQIIISRMRGFAMQALDVKNIQLNFEADKNLAEDRLGLEERQDLYLIFKESINNAVKYSEAKNIVIQILKYGRHYKMKIKDDGNGFEMSKVRKGNGLINMRTRAERMHAELKIDSAPGQGTVIDLVF